MILTTATAARTTGNVVKMLRLLFPEWVNNLTPESLQDFADKFSPYIGERELVDKKLTRQANNVGGPLADFVGQTRTFSQRNEDTDSQSPLKVRHWRWHNPYISFDTLTDTSVVRKPKTDGATNEPK